MRALVTGAGGFVGTHLARRLVEDGWDVVGTVRPGSPSVPGLTVAPVDLADRDQVTTMAAAADVDVAFLLAASRAQATAAAVNAMCVQWLLDALPGRCRTVVRLGSSTEYGALDGPMDEDAPVRPRGFFGATKAAGSLLLAAASLRGSNAVARHTVILRAFQVYGPGDHPGRFVPRAVRSARTGETLPLTGPGRRRDWVYVDDVVEACVRAALAEHLDAGEVLNIGSGHQAANEEVVATLERVSGRPIAVAPGAHPGRAWDTGSWVCDPTRARERLGWEAKVVLEEGLRRCWEAAAVP
ncbi:MAG: NAD-dependent epimerase/dehydratase family protein [Acidimicrobiales bacterium]